MGLWFMVCGLRKKSNHKPYGIVLRLFWKPQTTNHKPQTLWVCAESFLETTNHKSQTLWVYARLFLETTNHKPYGFVLRLLWKPQTANLMGLNAHISSALRA